MLPLLVAVLLLTSGPTVTVVDEPLCSVPLGAAFQWLADHDERGRFDLPAYAEWTLRYPDHSLAIGYLEGLAGEDVLGVFADHEAERLVLVVDRDLGEAQVVAVAEGLEADLSASAPPVTVVPSCVALERTRRVVDTLIAGSWHQGITPNPRGATWSVIPWPALGGAVEVWVAEVPAGLEDDLVALLGDDAELVRLVSGDDLTPVGLPLAPGVGATTTPDPSPATNPTNVAPPQVVVAAPSADQQAARPGGTSLPATVAAALAAALAVAVLRRRSARSEHTGRR